MNKKFLLRFIILCFLALTACAKEVYADPQIQVSSIPQEQTDLNSSDISDVKEIADDNAEQEDSMAESDVLPIENPVEEPDLTVTLPEPSPEPTGIVWEPFDENTRVEAVIDGESVLFTQQEAMDYVMSGKILTVHDGAVFDFDGDGVVEQLKVTLGEPKYEKMWYCVEFINTDGQVLELSYGYLDKLACSMQINVEDVAVNLVSLDKGDILILLNDLQFMYTDCWEEALLACRIIDNSLEFVGCFDSTIDDFVLEDGVYQGECVSWHNNIFYDALLRMDIHYEDGKLCRENIVLDSGHEFLTLVSDLYAYSDENEENVVCFESGHLLDIEKVEICNLESILEDISKRSYKQVEECVEGKLYFIDRESQTEGIVHFDGIKILPVTDKNGTSYSNDQYWMFEEVQTWVG